MKITKLGHCCLVIEHKGKKIMTDPGGWTQVPPDTAGIDLLLISHEHQDHIHVDTVKMLVANNPSMTIITNHGVGKLLDEAKIKYATLEEGQSHAFGDIMLEAFGDAHAEVYKEMGKVQNTGYYIDEKLFYPGDALTVINKPVQVLAAPVAGPWLTLKMAIEYILAIKPKQCFAVHDAVVVEAFRAGISTRMLPNALKDTGIDFVPLLDGESAEFE